MVSWELKIKENGTTGRKINTKDLKLINIPLSTNKTKKKS
jgi:hypothetical protein